MSRKNIVAYALGCVSFIYVLECLSPMRLTGDSVRYLSIAVSMAEGWVVDQTGFPPAYSAFIALLDKLNIAFAFTFNLANLAFLAAGLQSLRRIFNVRKEGAGDLVALMTMLSWIIIRVMAMPIPEPMFFGLSLTAVALMDEASRMEKGSRRTLALLGSAVLSAIAMLTRVAGVALVITMLWFAFRDPRAPELKTRSPRSRRWWVIAVVILTVWAASILVAENSVRKYATETAAMYLSSDFFNRAVMHMVGVFWTLGSVSLNVPGTRFHSLGPWLSLAGMVIGTAAAIVIRPKLPTSPVGAYTFVHLLVLTGWPYFADRLWIPIFPLIIGYVLISPRAGQPLWKNAGRVYLALFVVTGIAALAYSTRITFAGEKFASAYGVAGGMSYGEAKAQPWGQWHDRWVVLLRTRYANPF